MRFQIAINKRTALLFVLGLLALTYAGLTSYFSVAEFSRVNQLREHSSELINELDSLLASMMDIETGQASVIHTQSTPTPLLSVIKAALIIAYFMHLKFERLSLFLTLFPMLIFCIVLMLIFLGDAYRIPNMRPPV